MSSDINQIFSILQGLQEQAKLQQKQIDQLVKAYELTHSAQLNGGPSRISNTQTKAPQKRPLSAVLEESCELAAPAAPSSEAVEVVPDKRDHLDKLLDKPSFKELCNQLSIKLQVEGLDRYKDKDKIQEILTRACEKAKVMCAMNYDTLLSASLRKFTQCGVSPNMDSLKYSVSRSQASSGDTVCYAHNIEKFQNSMAEFRISIQDPCGYFHRNPRSSLLSTSCFSSTANTDYRSKRQRLPFAICCVKKPGYLSFFAGDWAYDDVKMPNSSNITHYITLHLSSFVKPENLITQEWAKILSLLESAACPADHNIGSITMFMHEHRGNMVCAKVLPATTRSGQFEGCVQMYTHCIRLYKHNSVQMGIPPVVLMFNDSGDHYLQMIQPTVKQAIST